MVDRNSTDFQLEHAVCIRMLIFSYAELYLLNEAMKTAKCGRGQMLG